jgi:CheY-like chemotaxis protein
VATRILIADDNQAVRDNLTEVLKSRDGWEVCGAVEDGQQAILKATELRPDLIILDLSMPVMDGLQAARQIGQILPMIPILIYTLHEASLVESEARDAGVRHVITKGNVNALLTLVENLATKAT